MEKERYTKMAKIENEHWWFLGRQNILQKVIDNFKLSSNSEILDFGCGPGVNLKFLSQYGHVTGLDMSKEACILARKQKIGNIIQKDILKTNLNLFKSKFDLIVLIDVLEHIKEDKKVLKKLNSLLKKKGHILLTVPANKSLWSKWDEIHHHQRRYSNKELYKTMIESGIKVDYITYYNFWLLPMIILVRWIKSKTNLLKNHDDYDIPKPLTNFILKSIFSSEKLLINKIKFPQGVSLIAWGSNKK